MKFYTKDIVAITFCFENESHYELEVTDASIIVTKQEKRLQAYATGMEEDLYRNYPNKKIDRVILTWYCIDIQGQEHFEKENIQNVKDIEFWIDVINRRSDSGVIPWKIEFSWDVKE